MGLLLNGIVKLVLTKEFPVCHDGYKLMLKWSLSFGRLKSVGFKGIDVYEVNRPNRAKRRLVGKSDSTDAENTTHSVLANESKAIPKTHDGLIETLRYLLVARRSTVKAKTQSIN